MIKTKSKIFPTVALKKALFGSFGPGKVQAGITGLGGDSQPKIKRSSNGAQK
jgi:hypothetical protein